LKSVAERFRVVHGPVPSKVITGTAMKVISDQAAPTSEAAITWPMLPPRCSREISSPTSAASAAQPAIAPIRSRATAKPSEIVASRPWKIASAVAASATPK
jgi:hypothetical protein